MRCPSLVELPAPPKGKTGWPWTIESPQLPDTMPDGKPWPRISIVTPSYNQGQFIEETIRSVLLQGYPDLEYVIMDGGSSDESVHIISKYQTWLTYWQSESDNGQSSAINSGFEKCAGEVGNWLNSDDSLSVNALSTLAMAIRLQPEAAIYTGGRVVVSEDNVPLAMQMQWLTRWQDYTFGIPDFPQEASFFKLSLVKQLGGINEKLNYLMDVDWYQTLLDTQYSICCIPIGFSALRRHSNMKTVSTAPSRVEEVKVWHSQRSFDWRQRLYLASKRFRLQALLARAFPRRQLITCFIVRYDGWQDRWVTYQLKP